MFLSIIELFFYKIQTMHLIEIVTRREVTLAQLPEVAVLLKGDTLQIAGCNITTWQKAENLDISYRCKSWLEYLLHLEYLKTLDVERI